MEKKGLIIGGKFFSQDIYNFLLTRFKESFSHASLSVERAFEKLDNCDSRLNKIKSDEAYQYYSLLDRKNRKEIDNYLKQFIVFYGCNSGQISINFNPSWTQKEVDEIFNNNFKYIFEDAHYILRFNEDGKFSRERTFREFGNYFRLYHEEKESRETAYNMQKDHMDAFDYAISLDDISIGDMVAINEKVVHSRPEKEVGFKTTNNAVFGSSFDTVDKELAPIEIQKLFADYKNDFGLEILDASEEGINHIERMDRILQLFKKEAIFHIKLMRIHPFNDGNGRTGRIIMNKHLLDNGMAPVLITGYMKDDYKRYIANCDYDGLANMMLSSSSQLLSNWVSMRKVGFKPKLLGETNAKLAEVLIEGDKVKTPKKKTLSKFRNSMFMF